MKQIGVVPGAASMHLVDGVSLLRPEEWVFSAMLTGFGNQQVIACSGRFQKLNWAAWPPMVHPSIRLSVSK